MNAYTCGSLMGHNHETININCGLLQDMQEYVVVVSHRVMDSLYLAIIYSTTNILFCFLYMWVG